MHIRGRTLSLSKKEWNAGVLSLKADATFDIRYREIKFEDEEAARHAMSLLTADDNAKQPKGVY